MDELGELRKQLQEVRRLREEEQRLYEEEKRRRKARGKGNRADEFCICLTSDEQSIPAVAIDYKPPHKLRLDELTTGLVSEIQPDRDVINQEGHGFEFAAR